jgi:hypothetical protein
MPTEKGKKYPYTKAGKAAAAAAKKKRKKVPKRSGLKKGTRGLKDVAKEAVVGGITGAGQGGVVKGLRKVAGVGAVLKRTPAMIRKQKAAMERAKKKRKAGKGYQK